eukprot:scaffold82613_cov33-Tisochrysis_lutea.AAC.5
MAPSMLAATVACRLWQAAAPARVSVCTWRKVRCARGRVRPTEHMACGQSCTAMARGGQPRRQQRQVLRVAAWLGAVAGQLRAWRAPRPAAACERQSQRRKGLQARHEGILSRYT